MWEITAGTAAALLDDGGTAPLVARLCARNLLDVRDLSVFEYHALRMIAPLAAVPPHRSPAVLADAIFQLGRKWTDESWSEKLSRSASALIHAFSRKSAHDRSTNHNPWER